MKTVVFVLMFGVVFFFEQSDVFAQTDLVDYEQKLEKLVQSGKLEDGERTSILQARELMRNLLAYEPQENLRKTIKKIEKDPLLSLLYYEEMVLYNFKILELEQASFETFRKNSKSVSKERNQLIKMKMRVQIGLIDRMLFAYEHLSKNELSDAEYKEIINGQRQSLLKTRKTLQAIEKSF